MRYYIGTYFSCTPCRRKAKWKQLEKLIKTRKNEKRKEGKILCYHKAERWRRIVISRNIPWIMMDQTLAWKNIEFFSHFSWFRYHKDYCFSNKAIREDFASAFLNAWLKLLNQASPLDVGVICQVWWKLCTD